MKHYTLIFKVELADEHVEDFLEDPINWLADHDQLDYPDEIVEK